MNELFYTILNMSISASILIAVVLLLRFVFRKAPKWVNVLLWALVAIRLVCPFTIESPFSLMPEANFVKETISTDDMVFDSIPDDIPEYVIGDDVTVHYYPTDPKIEIHRGISVDTVLNYIWLSGIAMMLIYMLVSYICVYRRIKVSTKFRDNIYTSNAVTSPFVFGIIKPRIYLPESLDAVNMSYVIAHEEAHLRRHDHWWKPIGFILLAIHWFNPIIWLAYILLCRDIEMACDERVIREMGESERADYSEALLDCSVNRRMITACPLAFGENNVKERIWTVLNYKKPAFWVVVVAMIACVAAALCFLTNPPRNINTSIEGIRFPCDDPSSSKSCFVEINGKIERDEFKGYIIIDGKKIETSIDMLGNTPSIRYYEGSRLKSYGLFYILNDTFSKFAFEINESDEYVICGMSLEKFENEMAKKNYYVAYQHDIDLYDFSSSDKDQILSNIYTEGCTVVIYGRDLNIGEINRTFYSGDNVMGTTIPTTYPDKSICYACISTCINDKVYIQYCRLTFGKEVSQADIDASLNDALIFSVLKKNAFGFRKEKLQSSLPLETSPVDASVNVLTLDDVIRLSANGYNLTWTDFEQFDYIETGSGLYIRVYEIDDTFELWIGGGNADSEPMYIYLTLADELDTRIDIRDGGVQEFIHLQQKNNIAPTDITDEDKENFTYTPLTEGLELTDPKTQIYSKMLNAIDYYDSAHIEFYPYMLGDNLKVVCELDLDSGIAYQASYVNNELTQEFSSDGKVVSELNHKRKYYDLFYQEAFSRADSPYIALADRVTTASDGVPCYYYRRNVTNCPLSSYTLFPQELAFSYLADFTRWDIVEEGTFLGRSCVVVEGNNTPYITDKHGTSTFRLTVDKETGIVLMLIGEKGGNQTKMIEVTALELDISSVYQGMFTDTDLSEYSIR